MTFVSWAGWLNSQQQQGVKKKDRHQPLGETSGARTRIVASRWSAEHGRGEERLFIHKSFCCISFFLSHFFFRFGSQLAFSQTNKNKYTSSPIIQQVICDTFFFFFFVWEAHARTHTHKHHWLFSVYFFCVFLIPPSGKLCYTNTSIFRRCQINLKG